MDRPRQPQTKAAGASPESSQINLPFWLTTETPSLTAFKHPEWALCPSTGPKLACLIVRPPSQRYTRATQIGETETQSSHLPQPSDSAKGLPCQNSNPEPIAFLGLTTTRRSCNCDHPIPTITNPRSQGTCTQSKKDTSLGEDTQQEPDTHSPPDCRRPDPYLTS